MNFFPRRTDSGHRLRGPAGSRPSLRNASAAQPCDRALGGPSQSLGDLTRWLASHQPPPDAITSLQATIHRDMLRLSRSMDGPNFGRVGRDDLVRLIHLIDDAFFGSRVLPLAKAEGLRMEFSSRMTSVAGKLVTHYAPGPSRHLTSPTTLRPYGERSFELILSSTLLFQTFQGDHRAVMVTGRLCQDRLEAMQRVAEHEMTHLVEMLIWNSGDCSQSRFQSIARGFFGHRDYQHDLITQRERAAAQFDVRVGDEVAFLHEGHERKGRVNRITRRVTVLVPDASGERFSDGKDYRRYYVPLEKVRRV